MTSVHKRRKYYNDHTISNLEKGLRGAKIGVWHWNGFKALVIASLTIVSLSLLIPDAYANHVNWVGDPFTPNDGSANDASFSNLVRIEVTDAAANTNPVAQDTVQVTITSSVNPTGITLTLQETAANSGIFRNNNLALMIGNDVFSLSDTATITIFDDTTPLPVIQTINDGSILILSDTDGVGITPVFTETGPNTNTYTAILRFGPASVPATNTLGVTAGDIISVVDLATTNIANGIISPNPSGFKGAITVAVGGGVTATYQTHSDPFTVSNYPAPGRGGGGLVAPGLVVDIIAAIASSTNSGNGCKGDCTPPTLGVDDTYKRLVNSGFSYNDYPVDVELYYTHYPLVTVTVGQENKAVLKLYDNSGPQNIEHVELAFGLGKNQILDQSNASISVNVDRNGTKTISKYDPENVLQNIRVETTIEQCSPFISAKCLVVIIYHTFRAPLEFNMVATDVWDFNRNSWQNYYNDGIVIIGESLNPPKEYAGIHEGHQIRIIEIAKNKAIDEDGNSWYFDKEWMMDYKPMKKIDLITSHGYDRNHDDFFTYKMKQESLAKDTLEKLLDGKNIHSEQVNESTKPIFDYVSRHEDVRLKDAIIHEAIRAKEFLDKSLRIEGERIKFDCSFNIIFANHNAGNTTCLRPYKFIT